MKTKTKRWRVCFSTRNIALEGGALWDLYGGYSEKSVIEVEAGYEAEAFAKAFFVYYLELQHDWVKTLPITEGRDGKGIPLDRQTFRMRLLQGERFVGTFHAMTSEECAKRYPRLTSLLCYNWSPGESATSLNYHRMARACDRTPYDHLLMQHIVKHRHAYKGYWHKGSAVRASVERYSRGEK